ncbi:uncharacterized protein DUF1329 [Pseudomonas sp. SLBN-26]|uniref:DUF1329 domain-containing protein n=1 Tax=Pseudomonadaceae TaxID=135621 RepID=UPI001168EB37|nr:DUF1329 domain-containing protein [Pseudomonas sp. SLBN-26]MCP1620130.1 hypothetical protein [Pseudomonas otitidis]TQL09351.1 uncharacterized protein DUF1329 [Pseudomonas sp. SLBN-26]
MRTSRKTSFRVLGCLALLGLAQASYAELTPFGAQREGNAAGTVPAWEGRLAQMPQGWQLRDPDPLAGEKPLFIVNAGNVAQYAAQLPAGQAALLKQLPGYFINVYPSHRSCGYPQEVLERTARFAGQARIAADGWSLENAAGAAIPFPEPKSGIEVMWNYKMRYMGKGRRYQSSLMLPGQNGNIFEAKQWNYEFYPHSDPALEPGSDAYGIESKSLYEVITPSARAGELYLIHAYMDRPQDAWIYFPGQRRVRRAPSFAYDNPVSGSDGLYMVDQIHMYSGAPDRYDFKLLGKREFITPYNTYDFAAKTHTYAELLGPDSLKPGVKRYELHRLWVVEATVKPGKRHTYAKRVFYFDEDSWSLQHVDSYDAKGNLWRVQDHSLVASPELNTCINAGFELYDLVAKRYLVDDYMQESELIDLKAGDNGGITDSTFNPSELRRRGER